jgi:aminoglycoside phosphotransferase
MKAGVNNRRFRLALGSEVLSVRYSGKPKHGGIQRSSELVAHRYAAEEGIAPAVVYADDTWLVHRYVDGRQPTPADLKDENARRALVGAVKAIRSGPVLADCLDPVALVREFASAARLKRGVLPKEFSAALQQLDEIAERTAGGDDFVMSHGDLWLDNLIWNGRKIWLLDWECAAMSHRYRDLAKICISAGFGPETRPEILRLYHGNIDGRELRQLNDLVQVEMLLHVAWCFAYGDVSKFGEHHDAHLWLTRFCQEQRAVLSQ